MIEGADHGLSEATSQQAYTDLLVSWLTEMLFGAEIGAQVARAQSRSVEQQPAEIAPAENPGDLAAGGAIA